MLFDYDLIIPAGTPQNQPYETLAKLTRGKLTEVRIMFPPGCATLAHVVIRHNLHQLVPANPEGTVNFDAFVVTSKLGYDLVDSPYEIRILGWSPSAIYDHIITCQFELEPIEGDTWTDFTTQLFNLNEPNRIKR